jgi:hypothetical protein
MINTRDYVVQAKKVRNSTLPAGNKATGHEILKNQPYPTTFGLAKGSFFE